MWLSAPMWITLLDPFALHAPFHHLQLVVFGLLEKDVLCATMAVTTTMGVDLFFSWVFLLEGLRGGSARRKDTRAHPHIQSHTGIVPAHEGGFRPHGEGVPHAHHVRRRSPTEFPC